MSSSQYDVCVHKPVIIGSGETDLKYGAALWFACCVAQAHESPSHNVFHGQSIFMKPGSIATRKVRRRRGAAIASSY